MRPDHHEFLIRVPGRLGISKLPRFGELRPAEQLLLLLITDRFEQAQAKVNELDLEADWVSFLQITSRNGLANLISEKLAGVDKLAATGQSAEYLQKSIMLIQRLSASETLHAISFDSSFRQILRWLDRSLSNVMWLKGVSLRHTSYPVPEQRFCSDFDVLVQQPALGPVLKELISRDFDFIKASPGFCNQLGLGPVRGLSDLVCVPSPHLVPRAVGTLTHSAHPEVDLKLTPLDRGLRLIEEERFWAEKELVKRSHLEFYAPSKIDHLIICGVNCAKDGFQSWKSFYDVHLLASSMHGTEWSELVRRCKVEGVSTDLWLCLSQSRETLATPIPDEILNDLSPNKRVWLRRILHCTGNYEFSWNSNSLPGLFLNALSADDLSRKMQIIGQCLYPDDSFIHAYYRQTTLLLQNSVFLARFVHSWLLFLPAIIIRSTLGRLLWGRQQQYAQISDDKYLPVGMKQIH
jgi:hypothetical protein